MKAIGLTGGIGSGKSTVARILKQMGFSVYIADCEASRLMHTHPEIRKEIIAHFGEIVYDSQGNINRPILAKLVFNNPDHLATINHIVHPRVMEDFRQWSNQQSNDLVFFESAILFEAGLNATFQTIICVTAPEAERLARVVNRDRTTPEQVRARIQNQLDDSAKCQQSDFIIRNDDQHMVIEQILEMIDTIKR